jgi:hypothetical protein
VIRKARKGITWGFFRSFFAFFVLLIPHLSKAEFVLVEQVSNPVGFLSQKEAMQVGTSVNTLVPALTKDGFAFGYWTNGETRLSDSQGRSLTLATVTITFRWTRTPIMTG